MRKAAWSYRVFLRYALWQLPGFTVFLATLLVVFHWTNLSRWWIWTGVVLWVVKDLFLFPRVWRAYDRDPSRVTHSMIGKKGIVESYLHPSGLIQVHGEIWRAEVRGERPSVDPGESVRIEEVQGLTLIVRPEREGAEVDSPASRLVKPSEGERG